MALASARAPLPWGESSPALGTRFGSAFHLARALSALVAIVGYLVLALRWEWRAAWVVVALSATIFAQALLRRRESQPSLSLALVFDIIWISMTYVVTAPPALVVVPGLTYLVVAPVLALDGWRAGRMVIAAKVGIALGLLGGLWQLAAPMAVGQVLTLAGLSVATHLPTMTWLIATATRTLRSRSEMAHGLAVQEARLRLITDSASDVLLAVDGGARIIFASRAVEALLGWRPEEVVGLPVQSLLLKSPHELWGTAPHGPFNRVSTTAQARAGHLVPVELTVGWGEEGGSPLLVCVLRDESSRRAAERRIDFQGALLDQVRLAVVGATPDGRLAYANATAVATFGLRPESMNNLSLANLLFDSGTVRDYVEMLKRSGSISREMELRDAAGSRFPALVNVTHLFGRDGASLGYAGVAVDITDRKRTEERLAALLASKDEFVTSVSHELRTPLTVILGLAEELQRNFDHFQPDDLRDLLSLIADQSRDLANIVQDLLVIGRAEAGGSLVINPTRVDVATELRAAAGLYLPADASWELEVNASAPLWADAGRVRQVIRNLLTNAARYGGPSIRISAREDGVATLITVADNGTGVGAGEAERIFEPYMRSIHGAALPASMGLGLAVARKLSLLMGGDLTYSRRGAWTVFELRLPNCYGQEPVSSD